MTVSLVLYGLAGLVVTFVGFYFHHHDKAQKNK